MLPQIVYQTVRRAKPQNNHNAFRARNKIRKQCPAKLSSYRMLMAAKKKRSSFNGNWLKSVLMGNAIQISHMLKFLFCSSIMRFLFSICAAKCFIANVFATLPLSARKWNHFGHAPSKENSNYATNN